VMRIEVSTDIDVPPAHVWRYLRQIERHTEWMRDAARIRITSERTTGAGTTFDTVTRLGPLRTTDRMTVTEWVEGSVMGVRHEGAVTGEGRFTLSGLDGDRRTRFGWTEQLRLPAYLGGRLGELVARPLLTAVWRRNLRGLRLRMEEGATGRFSGVENTIVVGVDGSPTSVKALRLAIRLAGPAGMRVVAVNAWGLPAAAAIPGAIDPAAFPPGEIYEDSARRVLEAAVASLGDVDVEIEQQVVPGSAAHVLLDMSAEAYMLVVGSRGHGGVAGLLLGSVSHSVVGKSKVPVLVVPHDEG